jgi:hypothetical protein
MLDAPDPAKLNTSAYRKAEQAEQAEQDHRVWATALNRALELASLERNNAVRVRSAGVHVRRSGSLTHSIGPGRVRAG